MQGQKSHLTKGSFGRGIYTKLHYFRKYNKGQGQHSHFKYKKKIVVASESQSYERNMYVYKYRSRLFICSFGKSQFCEKPKISISLAKQSKERAEKI